MPPPQKGGQDIVTGNVINVRVVVGRGFRGSGASGHGDTLTFYVSDGNLFRQESRRQAGKKAEEHGTGMSNGDLSWITNFIWGIADDALRDLYVRGKYRDVILPMMVLRRSIRSKSSCNPTFPPG